jgi:predicted DNA-binding transcriptional regulator AlpA
MGSLRHLKKRAGLRVTRLASQAAPESIARRLLQGDSLLTLKEVLDIVRHKKSWLYEQIGRGCFPAGYRFGDDPQRFWLRSEVMAALALLLKAITATSPSPNQSSRSRHKRAP